MSSPPGSVGSAAALGPAPSHGRALPVHGGRGAAPRAPALAPEEALLEVRRGRRRRRRARLAVPDAGVGRRVARLVRAPPLVLHGRGRERYDLVEPERDPVLPLALVHLLAGLALCNGAAGEAVGWGWWGGRRGRLVTWQARAVGQLVHERRGGVGVRVGRRRAAAAAVLGLGRGGRGGSVAPAPVLRRQHAGL